MQFEFQSLCSSSPEDGNLNTCSGNRHLIYCFHHPLSFYRTRVRSLAMLVTHSLPNSCLVNLIDVTLACEDANSILIEVVTVDAEKPVDNSLMQIWKLKFCRRDESLFRL